MPERVTKAAIVKERKRRREIHRAQTDLYYVSVKLGYAWSPEEQQGVTPELHGPLCERMDRLRDHPRVGTFAPRKSLKSTVLDICLCVQEILRDPDITIMINHAVEEEAENLCQEIADLFFKNEWLRSLDPIVFPKDHPTDPGMEFRIMPNKHRVKQFKKAASFYVRRPGRKPTTKRQPTIRAKGAGSEVTGAHCDLIILDDIIGRNTLEDASGMSRIRSWYKKTALNVLNSTGRIRLVGTRWDENDIYSDFIGSKDWDIVVRSARETDGAMDYNGEPIHFGPGTDKVKGGIEAARKREETALREMGPSDYAAQRMNDPSPSSEMPWAQSSCEHFTSDIPTKDSPGLVQNGEFFVLSDPAPIAEGGLKGIKEKQRGDGTKDFWSICVVRIQVVGAIQMGVLVDGDRSRSWTRSQGFDRICDFAKKYGTNKVFNEGYGGLKADFEYELVQAGIRNGVALRRELSFKDSYASGSKNNRIGALADWAKTGRFWILDPCPADFLNGNGETTGFLTQIRKFRPIPGTNRNNLKFDDDVDVVARLTDSALQQFSPKPHKMPQAATFSPFRDNQQEEGAAFATRYIRF